MLFMNTIDILTERMMNVLLCGIQISL